MAFLTRLENLIYDHAAWSQATFGLDTKRGPKGPLIHLKKEVREAIDNPRDIMEHADIFLLSLDALRRAGFTFQQLVEASRRKLEINKQREWAAIEQQDPEGVVEHISGEGITQVQPELSDSPVMESPDKVARDQGLQPTMLLPGDKLTPNQPQDEQVRLLIEAAKDAVQHPGNAQLRALASATLPFTTEVRLTEP